MAPKEALNVEEDWLDWQNLCEGMSARLDAVRKQGEWTDCELAVGKTVSINFSAHRVLLAAASPILAHMIFGPRLSTDDDHIALPFIEPNIFDIVLDYIYTDKINIESCEIACRLYEAAFDLKLSKVLSECRTYLLNFVSAKCAILVYEFAKTYSEKDLINKCLKLINTETTEVLEQVEVADADLVAEIFSMPHLDVESEMVLFRATERWLQKHAQLREECKQEDHQGPKEKIRRAVKQIRFLTVEAEEFAAHDTSSLLSESEMLAILMNLSSTKTRMPMPEGFSSAREPRILTIRMAIKDKFERVTSKAHSLHNLPWRIKFQRTGSGKNLLDVECNWGQIGHKWACTADVSLKILSQEKGKPHLILQECHTNRYHGYGHFRNHRNRFFWPPGEWGVWTNPEKGLVKNGCFIIEAKIMAKPPIYEAPAAEDRK